VSGVPLLISEYDCLGYFPGAVCFSPSRPGVSPLLLTTTAVESDNCNTINQLVTSLTDRGKGRGSTGVCYLGVPKQILSFSNPQKCLIVSFLSSF